MSYTVRVLYCEVGSWGVDIIEFETRTNLSEPTRYELTFNIYIYLYIGMNIKYSRMHFDWTNSAGVYGRDECECM